MDHIGRLRDEEDIPENVVSPIPDPEQATKINQKTLHPKNYKAFAKKAAQFTFVPLWRIP
jgi:hypothetical protein